MVFEHACALPKPLHPVKTDIGKPRLSRLPWLVRGASNRLIGKDGFRSGPLRIGYVRVSKQSQLTDRQVLQLEAECDEIRVEYVSAVAAERPVFDGVIFDVRRGDTVVVLDLDRAFRSAIDAILTAQRLRDRGVLLRVLSFPINTASEEGELFYGILALFAQFERRIISRRTREGLDAARRRGARLGRPAHLDPETIRDAHNWMRRTNLPCAYVAALLGVSRLTLQRSFRKLGLPYPISPEPKGKPP